MKRKQEVTKFHQIEWENEHKSSWQQPLEIRVKQRTHNSDPKSSIHVKKSEKSTCIRSLTRSSGAITVLAAAPAIAPAAKRAASLGTNAAIASGCLRSWADVGKNSLSCPCSATEILAKPYLLRLLTLNRYSVWRWLGPVNSFGLRPGISRHTSLAVVFSIPVQK